MKLKEIEATVKHDIAEAKTEPKPEITLPSRIEDTELAYHKFVLAESQRAQNSLHSWSVFISQKYSLGQGDNITEAGEIIRKGK